jgi:hypothetical protein
MIFEDRIQVNPRLFRLKDPRTNEIVDFEIQDLLPEEIEQEGTEITAENLNGQIVNEYSESTSNVYSADYINSKMLKVFTVQFTLGTFTAYQDKYDQTYTITNTDIPANYTPIGIVGHQLYGAYSSHCTYTSLILQSARTVFWGVKNNTDVSTGSLGTNLKILAIKNS